MQENEIKKPLRDQLVMKKLINSKRIMICLLIATSSMQSIGAADENSSVVPKPKISSKRELLIETPLPGQEELIRKYKDKALDLMPKQ